MKEKRMNADDFVFCFYFFLASRLLPFVNVSRKTRKAKTKRQESRVGEEEKKTRQLKRVATLRYVFY